MEEIVYVDTSGNPTGETAPKLESHHANTKLHLAFSCYVFNDAGEILVTKRAANKKVWPGFWTNSVCGHPLPSESLVNAIERRLDFELGMKAKDIEVVLPNYSYKTPPYNEIIENEFCPVYVAYATNGPKINKDEVSDTKWMTWEDFIEATQRDNDDYSQYESNPQLNDSTTAPEWSWWCKDQIKQLKDNPIIKKYSRSISF